MHLPPPLRRLRYSLVPVAQDTTCASCGRALRERRRRPCPTCGETARILVRGLELVVDADNRIS